MHVSKEQRKEYERIYDRKVAQVVSWNRIIKGYTQAMLAEKLGVSQAYVSRMERGRTAVSHAQLKRVAEVLGGRLMAPTITFDPDLVDGFEDLGGVDEKLLTEEEKLVAGILEASADDEDGD